MIFKPILIAALAAASTSSEPTPSPALLELVRSSGYQDNVARLFSTLPPAVFKKCPALVSKGSTVTIIAPVSFAPDGYPIAGSWKQSFPVKGCGNDTIINIFFVGRPDEKIVSIVGIPGETHADLRLQRDALKFATTAVRGVVRGCDQVHVRNTSDGDLVEKSDKAWQETWTVSACDRIFQVPLVFTPDATGTTVLAKPAKEILSAD